MEEIKEQIKGFRSKYELILCEKEESHKNLIISGIITENQQYKTACLKCIRNAQNVSQIISPIDFIEKAASLMQNNISHPFYPLLQQLEVTKKTLTDLIGKCQQIIEQDMYNLKEKSTQLVSDYVSSKTYQDINKALEQLSELIIIETEEEFIEQNLKVKYLKPEPHDQFIAEILSIQKEIKTLPIIFSEQKNRKFDPELTHQIIELSQNQLEANLKQDGGYPGTLLTKKINPSKIQYQVFQMGQKRCDYIGICNKDEFLKKQKKDVYDQKRTVVLLCNGYIRHNSSTIIQDKNRTYDNGDIIVVKVDLANKQVGFFNFTKKHTYIHKVIDEVVNENQYFAVGFYKQNEYISLQPMKKEYEF